MKVYVALTGYCRAHDVTAALREGHFACLSFRSKPDVGDGERWIETDVKFTVTKTIEEVIE